MSKCGCNRWGPGTTKERPPNTELSKELDARMAEIMKQRDKQDTIWTLPSENTKTTTTKIKINNESFFMNSK